MKTKILTFFVAIVAVALAANAQSTTMHQTYQAGNPAFTPPSHSVVWAAIVFESPDEFYGTEEAVRMAENVLLFQRDVGGWQKNTDMSVVLSESDKEKLIANKSNSDDVTFDNEATFMEMQYLAKVYNKTGDERFKQAFLKGLNYIFEAQYEIGGWPQVYPNLMSTNYTARITYNDGVTINALTILKKIVERDEMYAFVDDPALIERSREALNRGIDVVLKTQIRQNGVLTGWCGQHCEITLEPRPARLWELVSICGLESAGIAMFLMSFENPTPEMRQAIDAVVEWYERVKITGFRLENLVGENGRPDRRLVEDPNAPPLWARFYDLETNIPFFAAHRDGIKVSTFEELAQGSRAGYHFYVHSPQEMLDMYKEYVKK